ncbi:MAG: bifunctional 5,10-methylenetetrahydrofolate dehydrogenase/5,10-methenyltetrahydrofolate cyclohydrolase [Candidatus Dojkabacteria bacterium]|nr:MAG: bifunctional 5,10-methylenetetrahydrofolate dehydrogenase/5,10-methenyltetrahydrofolate cyclohydrolase [Candidatus Dojkabacteria bacterium]
MLLDGKKTSEKILADIELKLSRHENMRMPRLDIFLIGDDFGSRKYVEMKKKVAERLGYTMTLHEYATDASKGEVLVDLETVNSSDSVDGCMIQLPLPGGWDSAELINEINVKKDVDGLTAASLGGLAVGSSEVFAPATPAGIMLLLDEYGIEVEGKSVVIIGKSQVVGIPLSLMMMARDATVTVCHIKTVGLEEICRTADILISATGQAGLVNEKFIKEEAVVVDVGISMGADGKLAGDVDFKAVEDLVSYITPVPGGVGPMTIAALMMNVYSGWKNSQAATNMQLSN